MAVAAGVPVRDFFAGDAAAAVAAVASSPLGLFLSRIAAAARFGCTRFGKPPLALGGEGRDDGGGGAVEARDGDGRKENSGDEWSLLVGATASTTIGVRFEPPHPSTSTSTPAADMCRLSWFASDTTCWWSMEMIDTSSSSEEEEAEDTTMTSIESVDRWRAPRSDGVDLKEGVEPLEEVPLELEFEL